MRLLHAHALLALVLAAAACESGALRRDGATPEELWQEYAESGNKTDSRFCLLVQVVCQAQEHASNPICKKLLDSCSLGLPEADAGGVKPPAADAGVKPPSPDSTVKPPSPDSAVKKPDSAVKKPDSAVKPPSPDSGTVTPPPTGTIPQPICAWNQAYEEYGHADTVPAILAGAKGCYVLIDPFDSTAARSAIPQMKAAGNIVGCYISTGSCEDWRDDYAAMKSFCGPAYPGWAGEYFVTNTTGILPLMKARIDKMATWGCNFVEFDNMDWALDSGNIAGVAVADARAYNKAICAYTHSKGMKCMAKSTTDGSADFDGLTVESYVNDKNWWTASEMKAILAAPNKIGLIVHYKDASCDSVRSSYQSTYGSKISFVCSDSAGYKHY